MHSIRINPARVRATVALVLLLSGSVAAAQDMPGMDMGGEKPMKMAPNPLGISMNRAGSGTTWTPDALTLPSLHHMRGNWDFMVHGFVFGHYTDQDGPRGDAQAGSLNWGMFMATHELAGGRFSFRTMLSLDAWTVTSRGYPLLLQTGETYDGARLRDRQHPHDFWMELGATYEREITKSVGFSLYAAPSGEPALSPVAFMHRQSAMDNPFAPLSHHWQDATHVAFGVLTAGIFTNRWKIEGSAFNGREPDQHRWNIEPLKLDSWSGRITVNPGENWSATIGAGHLASPEILDPGESMQRVVGSLLHGAKLGGAGQVATTAIIGTNIHHGETSTMSLLESEAILNARQTLFGRFETGSKSAEDLVVTDPGFSGDTHLRVAALTAGYIHEILPLKRATIGLGGMATVNYVDKRIEGQYGSRYPLGLTAFMRLRPAFSRAADPMAGHQHH